MSDMTARTNDSTQQPGEMDEFLGTKPRPKWRRTMKFWLPALILVILVLAISQCVGGDDGPDYITEEVVQRSLDLTVTATGNLRPTNQVQVGSEVSGRIDRVFVDVNDRVAPGQVLAEINTDVIEDQITQGEAAMNAARARVEQARSTLDVDRAQLARLRKVFEISNGRVPSQVELEQAEAAVQRGEATVAAARAEVRSAQAQLSSSVTNRNRAVIRLSGGRHRPGPAGRAGSDRCRQLQHTHPLHHRGGSVGDAVARRYRRSGCGTGRCRSESDLYRRRLSGTPLPRDSRAGRSGQHQYRRTGKPAGHLGGWSGQCGRKLRSAAFGRQCGRPVAAWNDGHGDDRDPKARASANWFQTARSGSILTGRRKKVAASSIPRSVCRRTNNRRRSVSAAVNAFMCCRTTARSNR